MRSHTFGNMVCFCERCIKFPSLCLSYPSKLTFGGSGEKFPFPGSILFSLLPVFFPP